MKCDICDNEDAVYIVPGSIAHPASTAWIPSTLVEEPYSICHECSLLTRHQRISKLIKALKEERVKK